MNLAHWFRWAVDDAISEGPLVEPESNAICPKCGCLVDKSMAKKVRAGLSVEHYCRKCAPAYDRREVVYKPVDLIPTLSLRSFEFRYYREMEVGENGEPIGYKKVARRK